MEPDHISHAVQLMAYLNGIALPIPFEPPRAPGTATLCMEAFRNLIGVTECQHGQSWNSGSDRMPIEEPREERPFRRIHRYTGELTQPGRTAK